MPETEPYKIVHNLYNELLSMDVREYEQKTKNERLRRLDDALRGVVREFAINKGDDLNEMKKAIQCFEALDRYIVEGGISDFTTHERLKKAMDYFTANPDKLPKMLNQYFDARDEAWAGRLKT